MGKKKSLHKFTHIHLLKNDVQSKQKFDKHRKKKNHPNLLKNNNHVKKKKITSSFTKKKKNQIKSLSTHTPRKKKGKVSQESKR